MQDSTGLKNIALTAAGLALGCAAVLAPKAAVAEDAIAIASGPDEVRQHKQDRDDKSLDERKQDRDDKSLKCGDDDKDN